MKNIITISAEDKILTKPLVFDNKLSKRIKTKKEYTVSEFSDAMINGTVWCPALYNGSRKNVNWVSQSVFGLDFDNNKKEGDTWDEITPEQVIARLKQYGLKANCIYTTFSDSPAKRKFRVVFFLDTVVEDRKIAKFIMTNLKNLFPELDSAATDLARLFYPGCSIVSRSEERVVYSDLITVLNSVQITADKNQTRKVLKIAVKPSLPNSTLGSVGHTAKNDNNKPLPTTLTYYNYEAAAKDIKILGDLVEGKWLTYNDIFGIATNMKFVEGGLTWMRRMMLKANEGEASYNQNCFNALRNVAVASYQPKQLSNFSPYKSDHDLHNLLAWSSVKQGEIKDVLKEEDKPKLLTLKEAEMITTNGVKDFLNAIEQQGNTSTQESLEFRKPLFTLDTNQQYLTGVLKVAVGVGKTRELESVRDTLIACKTNDLKWELAKRMQHTDFVVTPDLPEFSNDKLNIHISNLYGLGRGKDASLTIYSISKGYDINTDKQILQPSDSDQSLAARYIAENRIALTYEGTVITTHKRAQLVNFSKHDTYIWDEDPLLQLLDLSVCTSEFAVFDTTKFEKTGRAIASMFSSLVINQFYPTPQLLINDFDAFKEFAYEIGKGDIIEALDSDYLLKFAGNKVHYAKKTMMPSKHNLIMSATASPSMWKLYNPATQIVDASSVEQLGKITQHIGYSYSKSSLNDNKIPQDVLDEMFINIGSKPVLTYKDFKDKYLQWNCMEELHYGKSEGCDIYKGMDIAVVGTPNKPPHVYFLYGALLGLKLKSSDNSMRYQLIEWDGLRFWFNTFSHEGLRDIQLSLLESELIQAVGRCRSLRTRGTAELYSSLPLRIAYEWVG